MSKSKPIELVRLRIVSTRPDGLEGEQSIFIPKTFFLKAPKDFKSEASMIGQEIFRAIQDFHFPQVIAKSKSDYIKKNKK